MCAFTSRWNDYPQRAQTFPLDACSKPGWRQTEIPWRLQEHWPVSGWRARKFKSQKDIPYCERQVRPGHIRAPSVQSTSRNKARKGDKGGYFAVMDSNYFQNSSSSYYYFPNTAMSLRRWRPTMTWTCASSLPTLLRDISWRELFLTQGKTLANFALPPRWLAPSDGRLAQAETFPWDQRRWCWRPRG